MNTKDDRKMHLQERAAFFQADDEAKVEKDIKRMIHEEEETRMWRTMENIRTKSSISAVTTISIPINPDDPPEQWKFERIHDQEEMTTKIIERNQKHFSQAQGSPPTDPFLVKHLGKYGEHGFEGLRNCLEEDLQHLLPETQELLRNLENNRLPEIETQLTLEEIKQGFRSWRESTSTSPSGRHMSVYHAMLAPEEIDPGIRQKPSEQFWTTIEILLNLCIKYGLALERWKVIHNTMLEKKVGNDRLDKLRVIHIFEADFNLIMGVMGVGG